MSVESKNSTGHRSGGKIRSQCWEGPPGKLLFLIQRRSDLSLMNVCFVRFVFSHSSLRFNHYFNQTPSSERVSVECYLSEMVPTPCQTFNERLSSHGSHTVYTVPRFSVENRAPYSRGRIRTFFLMTNQTAFIKKSIRYAALRPSRSMSPHSR